MICNRITLDTFRHPWGLEGGLYLAGGAGLDVGGADFLGPPLQAEVVGGVLVLPTCKVKLQVLLAELGAQECSEDRHTRCYQNKAAMNASFLSRPSS